jgi:branched-chain amino acid transport system permease protein
VSTGSEEGGALRSILPPSRVDDLFGFCGDHAWALLGVGAVVGTLPPVFGLREGYYMTVLTEMYLFAILALSWDLVGGQTGYPSFGNMAFFGIGAYTTAILVKDVGIAFPVAMVGAGLVAVGFASVIGIAVLRLRGHYFAIATLGVLLAAQQVSRVLDITGGASGKILLDVPPGTAFYYLFFGLLIVEMGLVYYLSNTRFGFVLNAIRDDEEKATAMGFNTTYYKTAAWMLAALFTGAAGGGYSLFNTFIDPQTAYNGAWNVELIAMALIGGTGTVAGPVIGAFGLHTIIEIVETAFVGWQLVILGAAVIVTVVGFPKGVVGSLGEYAGEMEYYKRGGMAAGGGEAAPGPEPDAEPEVEAGE